MKKKKIAGLICFLAAVTPCVGQTKTDTLYYGKDWKGVASQTFATYYRVIEVPDSTEQDNFRKLFRTYYITGELQAEGGYISLDKYDDSKSVFDGEITSYYKSGKTEEKQTLVRGKQEGEYTKYSEEGLILIHCYFKDGELNGIYTEFTEDGYTCCQIEYRNGTPLHDYCILSNKDGQCSKIRISDKKPIYESPALSEKETEYNDGVAMPYYNKNGILIGMTNTNVKDYGKYHQINIVIANNSMFPVDIDPGKIKVTIVDKNGKEQMAQVLTADEYMKKVKRRQNVFMAFNAIGESLSASQAGYSKSTTETSYSGKSSTSATASARSTGTASVHGSDGYAHGNYSSSAYGSYSGSSSYSGQSTSTTTTYDGAAAYQAQLIASDRIASYNNAMLSEREMKNQDYLKRTTVYPGETISGYINIARKKGGTSMTIKVEINGATYTFPWNIAG